MKLSIVKSIRMKVMSTDMFSYLDRFTNKCLKIDFYLNMSGDQLEYNNLEVGYTMKFMHLSHLFCYLEDH